jgi:hypothetical protein
VDMPFEVKKTLEAFYSLNIGITVHDNFIINLKKVYVYHNGEDSTGIGIAAA